MFLLIILYAAALALLLCTAEPVTIPAIIPAIKTFFVVLANLFAVPNLLLALQYLPELLADWYDDNLPVDFVLDHVSSYVHDSRRSVEWEEFLETLACIIDFLTEQSCTWYIRVITTAISSAFTLWFAFQLVTALVNQITPERKPVLGVLRSPLVENKKEMEDDYIPLPRLSIEEVKSMIFPTDARCFWFVPGLTNGAPFPKTVRPETTEKDEDAVVIPAPLAVSIDTTTAQKTARPREATEKVEDAVVIPAPRAVKSDTTTAPATVRPREATEKVEDAVAIPAPLAVRSVASEARIRPSRRSARAQAQQAGSVEVSTSDNDTRLTAKATVAARQAQQTKSHEALATIPEPASTSRPAPSGAEIIAHFQQAQQQGSQQSSQLLGRPIFTFSSNAGQASDASAAAAKPTFQLPQLGPAVLPFLQQVQQPASAVALPPPVASSPVVVVSAVDNILPMAVEPSSEVPAQSFPVVHQPLRDQEMADRSPAVGPLPITFGGPATASEPSITFLGLPGTESEIATIQLSLRTPQFDYNPLLARGIMPAAIAETIMKCWILQIDEATASILGSEGSNALDIEKIRHQEAVRGITARVMHILAYRDHADNDWTLLGDNEDFLDQTGIAAYLTEFLTRVSEPAMAIHHRCDWLEAAQTVVRTLRSRAEQDGVVHARANRH
ncbi:hypothetical protein BJ546DRAFT_1077314, partial [Cryomyces antarcticus]